MASNGRSSDGGSGTGSGRRHEEFAQKNAAWDRRVKSALSELDKAAGKVKRVASRGRRTPA